MKSDSDYIFLTRRIRLAKDAVLSVQPTNDGEGAIVITSRGAMRVYEAFSAICRDLYGATAIPSQFGANVGSAIAAASKGGAR